VRVVDSQVAQALIHAAQAVRLLGAQVALVGIRAEVAQAITAMDIAIDNIPVYGTLETAISNSLSYEQR
jgi:rsbT co-antagonist protein RsbR